MPPTLLGPSDEVLLAGFAASDPTASAAFVERFQRRVYGLALTVVGEPRAAEDVAQEAMVRAWRHGNAFDARRGSVVTWLLTITRNADIDPMRVALTTLPEEQRRAVVMAGIWGLTGREIAEREDIPLGTAKTRIRAGLRRLRDALADVQHTR